MFIHNGNLYEKNAHFFFQNHSQKQLFLYLFLQNVFPLPKAVTTAIANCCIQFQSEMKNKFSGEQIY